MVNPASVFSWFTRHARMILVAVVIVLLPVILAGRTPAHQTPLSAPPAYSAVRLPENYRQTFVHYATVDRRDNVTRDLYINPEALANAHLNSTLPNGTIIVIEGYSAQIGADGQPLRDADGHFIQGDPLPMVHVIEKRGNWSAGDFVGENRTGNWNFGSFRYDGTGYFDEIMSRCFDCHNSAGHTDFLYSFAALQQFMTSGTVQYAYCDLSGRPPC
ncbi:MAG: cytochrome P460 family protein [Anaerolineae bacterium]|nr:cytochrome P460 family protein [Anaerolineae bacterium]